MESRANYIVIGIFTIATLLIMLGFVWWLTASSSSTESSQIQVVFPGPVTGLNTGHQVLFNGIKVGGVDGISFDKDNPERVIATISVESNTPLRTDTSVTLGLSILSGIAHIEFTGGSADAPLLLESEDTPTIFAERSRVEGLIIGVEEVIDDIHRMVTNNETKINNTVSNVERFTQALSRNSEGVEVFMSHMADATGAFTGLASRMNTLIETTELLVSTVTPDDIKRTVDNTNRIAAELEKFVSALNLSIAEVTLTLEFVNDLIEDVDRNAVGETINNVNQISNALAEKIPSILNYTDSISGDFGTITKSIAAESGKIQEIIKNSDQIANNLNDLTTTFSQYEDQISTAINNSSEVPTQLSELINNVNTLVKDIDGVVSVIAENSPQITATLSNIEGVTGDIKTFTDSLEGYQQDIGDIVQKSENFADGLNTTLDTSSEQINTILNNVNSIVDVEGQGIVGDLTKTLDNINKLAITLEEQISPIVISWRKFSRNGLDNLLGFYEEARRTLRNLNQAVENFDKAPNRVIFGGSTEPTFDSESN